MKLTIEVNLELLVPKGTKNISDSSNPQWITLWRKNPNSTVSLFTSHVDDITPIDLLEEKNWMVFTMRELELALKLKR